jgi:hypothetical protein
MAKLTRRKLVRGLGAALLLGPFYALLERAASAQTSAGCARRLVLFFTPNGTVHHRWRPTGSGTTFDFPAGSILEPLADHKSRVVICDGIDFKNASNHEGGMAAMLTGSGTLSSQSQGMSVDQYIASEIGDESRFSSLELGVQTSAWGGGVQTRMSYSAPGSFVPPDDDPSHVFSRLFGAVSNDPTEIDRIRARRQSVIDVVREDVADLRARVGAEERKKLDLHLDSLRRVELGLSGVTGCAQPTPPAALNTYDNDRFPEIGQLQMDLLITALACDATRVASLQWSHTVAPQVFSWLGLSEGHHSLSHMDDGNAAGVEAFVKAERWYTEQFVYFLTRLAETPDPSGTGMLLDTTLLVWCKELGDGRLHDCLSVPFVLAGGGCFPPGRYVDFGGAPHQKLLVSLCQAMGLSNQTFGDASHGTGPLEGLA